MTEPTDAFSLHPQLVADTFPVTRLTVCDVLLTNDARYAWCILVPRITGLRDFHDVPAVLKMAIHNEIDRVSSVLKELVQADKMNVAALGNMVEQLHIHVIARHKEDHAWPGPVWGVGDAVPYTRNQADDLVNKLRDRLH